MCLSMMFNCQFVYFSVANVETYTVTHLCLWSIVVETTSCDFDMVSYSKFLQENGITNDGLWQREFLCHIPYGIFDLFVIF